MDDSCVFLVCLDRLFGVQIPNVDQFIVAGNYVGGCWGKLAVSDPVIVLFEAEVQPSIDGRPYFY